MLIELLRRAAVEVPEQPLIVSAGRERSYRDCLERSEAVGRGLEQRGLERFGIAVEDPADVLVALAGASAIGAEACAYPRDRDADEIGALAARLGHDLVVTDGREVSGAAEALPLEELPADGEPTNPPERAPVMILTTGTTGEQKGTRHEWTRLIAAVHADERPGSRWLLAYNLNQFAGIQIMLHVLASSATLIAPPTSQARDAIEAMRVGAVTHVSATPTFWRMLVGSLDEGAADELPLRQITLGGEAAPGPLIDTLVELFPDARVTHIYAGTEFGTVMSASDGRAGFPLSVLDRPDDAAAQLRIVDGELEMKSRIGMLGYHEDDDTGEQWLPTGDLVEVRDERIFFVGRKTEIINVGGAKVHPLPIEDIVSAVEGVELAAAYGRPNPVTGQIVAVDVVAAPGADTEALEGEIRAACQELPRPGRPRRIQFVEELSVRGSKLVRQGMAESDA